VTQLNKNYTNCVYYGFWNSIGVPDSKGSEKIILFNKAMGFIYWKMLIRDSNHYAGTNSIWFERKLIDYNVAP